MSLRSIYSVYISFLIICLVGYLRAESALLIFKAISQNQLPGISFYNLYPWLIVFCGIILWFLFYSIIIHIIARIMNKQNSFKGLISFLGFAYLPQIISSLIVFFLIFNNADYLGEALASGHSIKMALSGIGIYWTRIIDNISAFITYFIAFLIIKAHYNFRAIEAVLIAFIPPLLFEGTKLILAS